MLLSNMELLATAPGGVAKLRELILTLAVQGKLVPQDPADEPARELLKKIRAEKDRLIAEGKIRRDKPLAAIAEEEKPFELPKSWEWSRLGVLASKLTDGSHNPPRDSGAGYPMLSSQNVWEGGVVDFTSPTRYVGEADFLIENSRTAAVPGDVLLTIVASLGRSAVVPIGAPAFVLQRSVAVIRSGLNPEFCSLFLRSPVARAYYDLHGKGTAQKGIYLGKLGAMPIAVPPLAEQSRIVTRVQALMRLCDALEAKVQLEAAQHAQLVNTLLGTLTTSATPDELAANWQRVAQHFDLLLDRPAAIDALEQTLLQLAVRGLLVPQDPTDEPANQLLVRLRSDRATWLAARASTDAECRATIKKLRDLPDADRPFPIPSNWSFVRLLDCCRLLVDCHNKTAPYAPQGIPIIRTSNIRGGRFRLDDLRYVTEETYDFWSRRCPPEPGDIMFTREAPMGEAAIIPPGAKYCLGQRTMLVRPMHEFIDKEYLLLALTEPHLLERAAPSAIGSTVKHLRVGDVEGLTIPLPPLLEQSRIVTRVTALRRLCSDLRQRLQTAQATQSHLAQALVDSSISL